MKTAMTLLAGWVIGMIVLMPVSAWAVHPFQVEDTDVQGPGNLLLELYGDHTKDSDVKSTTYAADLHVGVSQSVDLALEVPYLDLNPSPATGQNASGLGDIELNLKQRIYENEVNQSIGYQVFVNLPTGSADKGLGTDNVAVGFKLMDQQGCCSTIYHVSLGYQSFAKDLENGRITEDSVLQLGFAVEHKLTGPFHLLAELLGEYRRGDYVVTGEHPITVMGGVRYDIRKSWYADLALRVGLNTDAPDYTASVGTAWRF